MVKRLAVMISRIAMNSEILNRNVDIFMELSGGKTPLFNSTLQTPSQLWRPAGCCEKLQECTSRRQHSRFDYKKDTDPVSVFCTILQRYCCAGAGAGFSGTFDSGRGFCPALGDCCSGFIVSIFSACSYLVGEKSGSSS